MNDRVWSGGDFYHQAWKTPSKLAFITERVWEVLKTHRLTGLPIAVRGLSGIVVGSALSCRYGSQLIIVRKQEKGHHGSVVEYPADFLSPHPFIILDDFVSTGKTINTILDRLAPFGHTREKLIERCRGIVLWAGKLHDWHDTMDKYDKEWRHLVRHIPSLEHCGCTNCDAVRDARKKEQPCSDSSAPTEQNAAPPAAERELSPALPA